MEEALLTSRETVFVGAAIVAAAAAPVPAAEAPIIASVKELAVGDRRGIAAADPEYGRDAGVSKGARGGCRAMVEMGDELLKAVL